jgi:hypothetical protein
MLPLALVLIDGDDAVGGGPGACEKLGYDVQPIGIKRGCLMHGGLSCFRVDGGKRQ